MRNFSPNKVKGSLSKYQGEKIRQIRKLDKVYRNEGLMYDLSLEKTRKSMTDYYEKIIRATPEYKTLIYELKNKYEMQHCALFNACKVVEIHHHPFTLYDLVSFTIDLFMEMGEKITTGKICEFVLLLHYEGLVGLVPLNKTAHSLYHDGQLFIPLTWIGGCPDLFIEKFKDHLDPHYIETYNKIESLTKMYDGQDPLIFRKTFTYLEVEGVKIPQLIQK